MALPAIDLCDTMDAGKAIFLSYASQDADAARRICEALRQAGIEVWFDQSELVGGDAWDAKIRKQIKDCALFVPLISANTQTRREGYFRIEWRLAAQRTHAIAEGTPFLLPIVIDETPEPTALVPAEFRDVQWTRLSGKDTAGSLAVRIERLLRGPDGSMVGARSNEPGARGRGQGAEDENKRASRLSLARLILIPLGVALLGVGGWVLKRPKDSRASVAVTPDGENTPAAARNWPRDPELKRAIGLIDGLDATLEDFRLADEIATRGLERAPADPEAVTVRARVHSAFLMRNFDFSSERAALAKRYGERAVQLAPDEPQAYYALSIFLLDRAGDAVRAEELARRACGLSPGEPRFWRQTMRAVIRQRPDEGLAMGEELIRRFPRDVLTHYELSIAYRDRRDWERFERETDATLALAPLPNAINWKARSAILRSDWAGMRQWLERIPARARAEERAVVTSFIYAVLSGDYDFGLKALQGFAEPWFFDTNNYSGPAALPRAILLDQQGKSGLARTQYELALAELARHRAANPTDLSGNGAEIWILLGLGRREEALASHRTVIEALRRPFRVFALTGWWFDSIPRSLLLGDRATAMQLLREAAAEPEGRATIRRRMQADARMAPFREDPEITELLAEPAMPEGQKVGGAEGQKAEGGGQRAKSMGQGAGEGARARN